MKSNDLVLLSLCLILIFIMSNAFADHDDKHKKRKEKHFTYITNETYTQECGACHSIYQPWLLPSGSWSKILSEMPLHFGEDIQIKEKSFQLIKNYLQTNATEFSNAKRSKKILKSLKGQLPMRITEVHYIKKKHHELDANVFNRKSIGSFSNCAACHPNAGQGNFDDDYVKIPK